MKNHFKFLSLLIVIAGAVVSCSKTDPAVSQASLLIGSWKAVSFVRTNCTTTTLNEALVTCTTCETLVVTATTVTSSGGSGSSTFSYTVSGSTIVTVPPSDEVITFVVAGTTLTITAQSPATGVEANCKNVNVYSRI